MSLQDDITEIKIVESPTLSSISDNPNLLKRVPSLNRVVSWCEEENRTPLINAQRARSHSHDYSPPFERILLFFTKYESKCVTILLKLILHILLISIFETLFFFMYVSTLEDNGIQNTTNIFINESVNRCTNMTIIELDFINLYIAPYINRTQINIDGDNSYKNRTIYNHNIMNVAWSYVAGISMCFLIFVIYSKVRMLQIEWKMILIENITMVGLLAGYEILFFNNIIYFYLPVSSVEITQHAINRIHDVCHIF